MHDHKTIMETGITDRGRTPKGSVTLVRVPEKHMLAYLAGRARHPAATYGTFVSRGRNYVAEARAKKAAAQAAQHTDDVAAQ